MSEKTSHGIWVGMLSLAFVGVEPARGQHDFSFTKTVDPSGRADFTTIQGAIDSITPGGDRWTVLIYAGEYDEAVTLGADDENIDLVGIDRGSVIINATGFDTHGIVITSGTETSRNNRIANLTIKTADGIGIKIVKGGTPVPKDIAIEGVTIDAKGPGNNGIEGSVADTVRIFDCKITSQKGLAINRGKNFDIVHTVLSPAETKRASAIRSGKKGAGSSQSDVTAR